MIISVICAMDQRNGIGLRGNLPWRISTDLRRFKQITLGHHLIAGRKTYESIGRALADRVMIVVSRNLAYKSDDSIVVHSLEQALETAKSRGEKEVFVIGGAQLYKESIDYADRIYLTLVHTIVDADVYFPAIDFSAWDIIEKKGFSASEIDQYPHTFMLMVRSSKYTDREI